MSPFRDNRNKLLAIAAVLAVVVIIVFVMSPAKKNVGALAVVAQLSGGGAGVSEIAYTVSGNGIAATSGTARVAGADGTPISVKDLPPDTDYEIELSAASPDGKTKCNRRTPFDVTVGKTTSLTIVVLCRDMTRIAQFVLGRKAAAPTLAAVAPPPPPIEVTPECTACEQAGIKSGECEADSGCDGLEGNDKTLCVNLVNCMRATNCWIKDPLDCLCGTARDEACITNAANGDCRAEMQAATKTTDPVQNGTLFYESSVPAGRANRLISCDKEKCRSRCSVQ